MNKTTDRFSVQRGRKKQARRLHKGVLCHCTMVQVRVSVKIRLIPLLWMGNWEMLILCVSNWLCLRWQFNIFKYNNWFLWGATQIRSDNWAGKFALTSATVTRLYKQILPAHCQQQQEGERGGQVFVIICGCGGGQSEDAQNVTSILNCPLTETYSVAAQTQNHNEIDCNCIKLSFHIPFDTVSHHITNHLRVGLGVGGWGRSVQHVAVCLGALWTLQGLFLWQWFPSLMECTERRDRGGER